MHKQQQAATTMDQKLLEMELRIQKTLNETMEKHIQAVQAVREEMAVIRQMQEKQRDIMVELEASVQELNAPEEDGAGGEDQPGLDSNLIDLEGSLRSPILGSTAIPILPRPSFMKGYDEPAVPTTSVGESGSSLAGAFDKPAGEGVGPAYADSVKEQAVPKVLTGEKLCPMGTGPPGMAFKEKEVPDTFSATLGHRGETSEGFRLSGGTGFAQPIHPGYTQQLKLEPLAKYSGQRQLGVRAWLMQEERYLRLSRFSEEDWVEIAALRLDGAAATWANALLLEVSEGHRMPYSWEEFRTKMIARFESVTENEEARRELRELRQIGRVAGYTAKFQELRSRLPSMTDEEAFSVYLAGLNSHIREQVGAHVKGNLEEAITMAQRIEIYRGGDSKNKGQSSKKFQKKNKNSVNQVQGQPSGETPQVNAVQPQQKKKSGQKGKGNTRRGGRRNIKCHCCGGNHLMRDCKDLKEAMAKLRSPGN